MIVAKCFKGDSIDLQSQQHDQYVKAIEIIFDRSRRSYLSRFQMDADNEFIQPLIHSVNIDHRAFQSFHDQVAAFWRKKKLRMSKSSDMKHWLEWLDAEMVELSTSSKVSSSICFLALERYSGEDEKRVIEDLEALVRRRYPTALKHYVERVSFKDLLNAVFIIPVIMFVMLTLYSGLIFAQKMPIFLFILSAAASAGYIYVNWQKIIEQTNSNLLGTTARIGSIVLCSLGLVLLLAGFNNFQEAFVTRHLASLLIISIVFFFLYVIGKLNLNR